jgi:hypothetical protein
MLPLTSTTACSKRFNPAFPVARSFATVQPAQHFGSAISPDAYTAIESSMAFSPFRLLTGGPAAVQAATSSASASSRFSQNPVGSLFTHVAALFQGKSAPPANAVSSMANPSTGLFLLA